VKLIKTAGGLNGGRLGWGAPRAFSKGNEMNKLWKCEQLRAGQVYNRMMFDTREEAEQFVAQMRKVEPDLFWQMEPVEARMVWN
jgi:hypothetical protein